MNTKDIAIQIVCNDDGSRQVKMRAGGDVSGNDILYAVAAVVVTMAQVTNGDVGVLLMDVISNAWQIAGISELESAVTSDGPIRRLEGVQ